MSSICLVKKAPILIRYAFPQYHYFFSYLLQLLVQEHRVVLWSFFCRNASDLVHQSCGFSCRCKCSAKCQVSHRKIWPIKVSGKVQTRKIFFYFFIMVFYYILFFYYFGSFSLNNACQDLEWEILPNCLWVPKMSLGFISYVSDTRFLSPIG